MRAALPYHCALQLAIFVNLQGWTARKPRALTFIPIAPSDSKPLFATATASLTATVRRAAVVNPLDVVDGDISVLVNNKRLGGGPADSQFGVLQTVSTEIA